MVNGMTLRRPGLDDGAEEGMDASAGESAAVGLSEGTGDGLTDGCVPVGADADWAVEDDTAEAGRMNGMDRFRACFHSSVARALLIACMWHAANAHLSQRPSGYDQRLNDL